MGMFDSVYCKYPLPDCPTELVGGEWQTKAFDCELETYTITEAGRLLVLKRDWKWKNDDGSPFGGWLLATNEETVDTNFHGTFNFYSNLGEDYSDPANWYEYVAKFTDGQLVSVTRLEKAATESDGQP